MSMPWGQDVQGAECGVAELDNAVADAAGTYVGLFGVLSPISVPKGDELGSVEVQ